MNQLITITEQLKNIIPIFEKFNIGEEFPLTQSFSKEVIDHVSNINKINFENIPKKDLIDIISSYSYLGLNSKEPLDELIWRDGEKPQSELFIITYDEQSNCGVINENLSYILKNELKIYYNEMQKTNPRSFMYQYSQYLMPAHMSRRILHEYCVPFNDKVMDILFSKNSRLMKWYIDTQDTDTNVDINRLLCLAIVTQDLKMIDVLLATLKDENDIIQISFCDERTYLVELLRKFKENNFILNESIVKMKVR